MAPMNNDSGGGKMELLWSKNYNGTKIEYIDQQSYCYLNGKNIINSGDKKPFVFPGKGISAFAVHKLHKHVAIGSRGMNPDIYIYHFPSFESFTTLKSCAKLEYCVLAFSSSNYLASLSGIPDFQLCIWNYKECTQLCSIKMPDEIPTSLSFNYGSWRQLGVTYTSNIYYCNIVRCHTYHELHCKIMPCPTADVNPIKKGSVNETCPIRSVYDGLQLSQAAKAGQIGERAKELTYVLENVKHVTPLSQCWLASGTLYIGCKEGHVLKRYLVDISLDWMLQLPFNLQVDMDSDSAMILFHPQNYKKIADDEEKPVSDGNSENIDSIDFIAVHQIGLFAASKNGIIQQFAIFGEEPKLLSQYNTRIPISSFTLTLDYEMILIGSPLGLIQLHKTTKLDQVKILHNESSSPFVDMKCVYPGTQTAVTIQQDGLMQLWNIHDGQKIAYLKLHKILCAVSCSPISYALAIGCANGYVCIIDVQCLTEPRLVSCQQLCSSSITHVHFDYNGDYLFAVSQNNHFFIQDGSATKQFQMYGYLHLPGSVSNLTTDSFKDVDVYISICYEQDKKEAGADRLIIFRLNTDFKETYADRYLTEECDFDPFKMQMKFFTLLSPTHGLTAFNGEAYVHSQKSCKIIKLPINEETHHDLADRSSEILFAHESYDCHQLPGIDLCCSDDYKWLASCGKDGLLQLCLTNNMHKNVVKYSSHDLYQTCAKTLCLTADCYHVLLTSEDGSVSCYNITYTSPDAKEYIKQTENDLLNKLEMTKTLLMLESRAIGKFPTVEPFQVENVELPETESEVCDTDETSGSSPENSPPPLKGSWIEMKKAKHLHNKNEQFSAAKKHIRDSIKQMRQTVQKMLRMNANLPELERLERYEFDLDVEEQTRLQQEAKEAVLRVYEKIEHDNLGKLYLKKLIKTQCFDDMKVKGRTLKAFLIPLEVSNFPLLERPLKTRNNLEIFKRRRNIEKQVDAINKEIMESLTQPVISSSGSQLSEEFSEEELEAEESGKESKEDEVHEDDASSTPISEKATPQVEEKPKQEEETPAIVHDLPSTDGSLGFFYGGGSEYLYNQFDLHSRYQKIAQIILLQDILYRIKETFNKEFDELYQRKELEISRIKEKNKRISQIIKDLEIDEKVLVPEMNVYEKPEQLLTVQDSEVKVEKYMTPEQRKALEEAVADEEQRKKMKADYVRERALVQMMNGVLEIKKEDELKKDIPLPHVGEKEEDWTEDEAKMMKEYERKVKELNEEREKYRKNLETELKKMQGSILESMSNFDDIVNSLFHKNIQVVKTIHQEKLKINRIKLNLMVQNVLDCQEHDLLESKQEKIQAQTALFNVLAKSEKMISDYRVIYDNLVAEDKASEKSFKYEFPGVPQAMIDNLLKLFRKKPKAYKYKVPENFTSAETDMANIFQDRLSISQQKTTAHSTIEAALDEFDRLVHMPEGLEPKIWMKFCQLRRTKVAREQEVRNSALTLAEMNAFHQEKLEEQERLRNNTDEIEAEIKKLKKSRQQFNIDIEIQLLLKQGQVELETDTFIYNFLDSVLIHRCIVEELNGKIKELAEQKISSMEESKDFKKGIFQQEWEHRKMMMQMEDLRQKMSNIQYLKVTREVQEYLENQDYDAKKSCETDQLEKSLTGLKEIHNRKAKKITEDIKKLRMMVFQKQKDNESLLKQIEILNVEVNERHHIMDVSAEKREYLQVEKKYREIKQRKKMVDLAKSQAAELAVLRKEVERLRMKTFPALL